MQLVVDTHRPRQNPSPNPLYLVSTNMNDHCASPSCYHSDLVFCGFPLLGESALRFRVRQWSYILIQKEPRRSGAERPSLTV